MKYTIFLIVLSVVNLIAIVCATFGLPAVVPTHIGPSFVVDAIGSPWSILILGIIPVVCAITMLVEKKFKKNENNKKPLNICVGLIIGLTIYLSWVIYLVMASGAGMGEKINLPLDLLIILPLGLLFVFMGNYLPTVKQNGTLGLKCVATLNSENVWNKTHSLGGILFVIGGLITIAAAFLGYALNVVWISFVGLLTVVVIIVITTLIYAHLLYKKELSENAQNTNATKNENTNETPEKIENEKED